MRKDTMNRKRERDEHIERLYYMKEEETDYMGALKSAMSENFNAAIIDELVSENMVELTATIILAGSLIGIGVLLYRKIPMILELPKTQISA